MEKNKGFDSRDGPDVSAPRKEQAVSAVDVFKDVSVTLPHRWPVQVVWFVLVLLV